MNNYSDEVARILKQAEREMLELKHPYVGTEHLLLSLLQIDDIKKLCNNYNLTYQRFRQELINIVGSSHKRSEVILYTPLLRMVLEDAKFNNTSTSMALMSSLLSNDDGIALRVLMLMGIDIDAIDNEINKSSNKILSSYGTNLNDIDYQPLIGREKEIEEVEEILLRRIKNNPLLIGEAGVGKSAIVYELARRIKKGLVPNGLKDYQIVSIDMASLLSNTKYRGEFETKINNIIKEIKHRKNVILFIDEIHTIIKSGGGESSVDAANILKPYLASDEIKIIGATTISEYEHSIARDKALSRRFMCVMIEEPSIAETKDILLGVKNIYEAHHHLHINDENIEDIINYANRYITNNHNPDKSLDVLDHVCSHVSMRHNLMKEEFICHEFLKKKDYKKALEVQKRIHLKEEEITLKDIKEVIERICHIHLMDEETYNNLCLTLDEHVIGQDLTKLKTILKSKMKGDKLIAMTFNGIAGVGKHYTASLIASTLKYQLLDLDMKEFTLDTSVHRFLGADPGYVGYEDDKIIDKIKYHPYTILYLDNYHLANQNLKNIISSIIKNGYLRSSNGDLINFNNTIIIMSTDIKEKEIGYLKNSKEDDLVINFNKIDKKCLEGINKYKEILPLLNDKITFQEVNKVYDNYIYNY